MKKFISMLLAVNMIIAMLAFSVSANAITVTPAGEDLVGRFNDPAKTGTHLDGESTVTGSREYDIIFSLTGKLTHRYAVDIVATNLSFHFGTDMIWNVNTLDYVSVDGTTDLAPTTAPTFLFRNYSDQSVRVFGSVAMEPVAASAGLSLGFSSASITINQCVAGMTAPLEKQFVAYWSCNDWAAALGILKTAVDSSNNIKVATITFTVSAE